MFKKCQFILATLFTLVSTLSTQRCFLENHRDGYRFEILSNSEIQSTIFEIKVPKNLFEDPTAIPQSSKSTNKEAGTQEKPTTTIFKFKLCGYLTHEDLSPCNLSHSHKLNIANMNLCTGISKWRLNDDFMLPPFLVESLNYSGIEEDKQIRLNVVETGFFEMMKNKYSASWKNKNLLLLTLYSNEGSIKTSRLYSYWPNFFNLWVPFRDIMLILSGFVFKKFTKQAEARRIFILASFVTDISL